MIYVDMYIYTKINSGNIIFIYILHNEPLLLRYWKGVYYDSQMNADSRYYPPARAVLR